MKQITWTLSEQEASVILQLIGQMPTSANAYPLWLRLKSEAESQLTDQEGKGNVDAR